MYEPLLSGRVPINVSTVCICTSSASDAAPSPPSCLRAVPRSKVRCRVRGARLRRWLDASARSRRPHSGPLVGCRTADSARSMLTLCSACRRTMRGRILESKNKAHIGVGSARRACDSPAGRGCAREVVARDRGCCVCSRGARRAWRQGAAGPCFWAVVRMWGRAGYLPCLLCNI